MGNEEETLPPVFVPDEAPWYVKMLVRNWERTKAWMKECLDRWLVFIGAAMPVLYENAAAIKTYVSASMFHYMTTAYFLFTLWKMIRNARKTQPKEVA